VSKKSEPIFEADFFAEKNCGENAAKKLIEKKTVKISRVVFLLFGSFKWR
jgi:hypothetical protein